MATTKIPWCDKTWNPIIGCSEISAGCAHCYAERMARRQVAMGNRAYDGTVDDMLGLWTGKINFVPEQLNAPLHWRKPCRIFVCSMGDIFHHESKFAWINKVFGIIDDCEKKGLKHTFIILTKRPDIARKFFKGFPNPGSHWKNVWFGVTVEDQSQLSRIYNIAARPIIPVAKLFVSCEPMLESIWLGPVLNNIDWVICGSESGPGARPMNPNWARILRNQCQKSRVPFFLKQMTGVKTKDHKLPELDCRTWGEFPE
jgi:protein gp37